MQTGAVAIVRRGGREVGEEGRGGANAELWGGGGRGGGGAGDGGSGVGFFAVVDVGDENWLISHGPWTSGLGFRV